MIISSYKVKLIFEWLVCGLAPQIELCDDGKENHNDDEVSAVDDLCDSGKFLESSFDAHVDPKPNGTKDHDSDDSDDGGKHIFLQRI